MALAYVKPKERVVLTEDGMELLIRRYGDSLLRLCTLYLRDPYLAEDAVQDTYLKVWRHYQKFEGRASEKTWITRIAINTCKSYLASAWRKRVEMTEITQVLEEGLQNSSGNRDTYEKLNNTIDLMKEIMELKDKYRLAILLYYYQELPVPEIALIMGRQESTVFTLLKRGREQLRKKLSRDVWEVL
ncbi:MAG TPA: RNA polymerase subunit sigma-24 [Lachnospiraceae bacterium]|nr:RNA polymerase subunit sigma-24 [Lachnospiraceae bacterium]